MLKATSYMNNPPPSYDALFCNDYLPSYDTIYSKSQPLDTILTKGSEMAEMPISIGASAPLAVSASCADILVESESTRESILGYIKDQTSIIFICINNKVVSFLSSSIIILCLHSLAYRGIMNINILLWLMAESVLLVTYVICLAVNEYYRGKKREKAMQRACSWLVVIISIIIIGHGIYIAGESFKLPYKVKLRKQL